MLALARTASENVLLPDGFRRDACITVRRQRRASNIGTANEKLMGGLRKTTNADRLRAMSDEELANFVSLCCGWTCAECPVGKECNGDECFSTWLDWLKQEVQCTSG